MDHDSSTAPSQTRTVLITGASAGIGAAFADVFASHGFVNGRNLALEFYGFDVPEARRETATSAELIESGRHMAGSMARAGLDCIVSNGEATTRWLFEATRSVPGEQLNTISSSRARTPSVYSPPAVGHYEGRWQRQPPAARARST